MTILTAVIAGIGCSLCNGISTVQQKIGADDEGIARHLDLMLLVRLFKNIPYVVGVFLEIAGYGLSLVALRVLPLFFVQSLIAASVIVTALGERVYLHKRFGTRTYIALAVVLSGLTLLSISARTGPATVNNTAAKLLIETSIIPLGIIGIVFIYSHTKISAFVLAAVGGLLFGNTSSIGRILIYPHPFWKIIDNPLLYTLIISSILAQYFFTVSLQRTRATKSNAIMISMQTLGPALCGLLFFDDKIRAGFEVIALLGGILVITGSAATAVDESPVATI
jgi:drug/metabolite transporter (DMT)-like permease